MNQGFGPNLFGPYGDIFNRQLPHNGIYQHRQPNRGHWNTNQAMNVACRHQGSNRFSSPQHFPPRGPGFNPRQPGLQRFHNYQPRPNRYHQNPHDKNNFKNARKPQRKKIDKRELPENNKFFCDTCDRGFCSEEKFKEHVNGHEKCSDPSCSYVAAPKLVKLHFQMQHRTGLASKIWKLESPEDIRQWIADRKRNFPTAANVERKKAVEMEKRARGEKLETKYFGKMKGGHNTNNKHRGRYGNRKRRFDSRHSGTDDHTSAVKTTCTEDPQHTSRTEDNNDDPLSAILEQSCTESKAAEDKQSLPGGVNVAGGLASIIASYAADSDTEDSPVASPKKHKKSPHHSPSNEEKQKPDSTDSSGCISHKQQKKQRKKNDISNVFNSKQPTLLERLLAKEIRHERNVLLQCVHYIVKKDFFGVQMDGKKSIFGS